jgi:hypothetical protein
LPQDRQAFKLHHCVSAKQDSGAPPFFFSWKIVAKSSANAQIFAFQGM